MPDSSKIAEEIEEAKKRTREAHLPPVQFMFTLDQIAYLMNVPINKLASMVTFEKTQRKTGKMRAVNILPSPLSQNEEWRIPYDELVSFMKRRGIVIYERRMRTVKQPQNKKRVNT